MRFFISTAIALIVLCSAEAINSGEKNLKIFPITSDISGSGISGFTYYFTDTTGTLGFKQISSPGFQQEFKLLPENTDNELKNKYHWIRFSLRSELDTDRDFFLEPGSFDGTAEIYIVSADGKFRRTKTGVNLPVTERDVTIRNRNLVNLSLKKGQEVTVYCLIKSDYPTTPGFAASAQILPKIPVLEKEYKIRFLDGLFGGIFILRLIHNLILFISISRKVYLYYTAYVLSVGFLWYILRGYTAEYYFSDFTGKGFYLLGTIFISYSLFAQHYLELKKNLNTWYRIMYIPVAGSLIFMLAVFIENLTDNNILNNIFSVVKTGGLFIGALAFILAITPSIMLVIKRKGTPGYFLAGNLLVITGPVLAITGHYSGNAFLEENALQLGVLMEGIIYSVGIGKSVNSINKEKHRAQEEIISQLKLNEEIKDKANRELEEKVQERTAELSLKNDEITDSIKYALRIQNSILPPIKYFKDNLPENFLIYKPKDIVSGDFYWMHLSLNPSPRGEGKAVLTSDDTAQRQSPLSPGRGAGGEVIYFAAADCTGHGVPGAMVSVICSNALNRAVKEFSIKEPGKILDKVKELVIETFDKSESEVKDGMDIALCALEVQGSNFKVHFAGANNPLWIIRPCHSERSEESKDASFVSMTNYELLEVKADKQPIGKYTENKPFTTHTLELQKGDTIYIFTDGFADQFGGEAGKKFKSTNFKKLLLSIQDKSMKEQQDIITETFNIWKVETEQVDDVCVIGVKV
jgi:serine phosphatase RsbU (regulator of sigma subunit)